MAKLAVCCLLVRIQQAFAARILTPSKASPENVAASASTQSEPYTQSLSNFTEISTSATASNQPLNTTVPPLRVDQGALGLSTYIPDVAIVRFIPAVSREAASSRAQSAAEFYRIDDTSVYYRTSLLRATSPAADTGNQWWAYQIPASRNSSAPDWGVRPLQHISHVTADYRLLVWVMVAGEQLLFTPEEMSQGYEHNAKLLEIMGTKVDMYTNPTTWFKPLCAHYRCRRLISNLEPAPMDDWYPVTAQPIRSGHAASSSNATTR